MTENEQPRPETHGTYDPDDDATKVPEQGYGEPQEVPPTPPEPVLVPEALIEVHAANFLEGIERTKHALSSDEARPILAHLLIESTETGLRFVAADSYRIALQEVPLGEPVPGWGPALLWRADLPILVGWLKTQKTQIEVTIPEHRQDEVPRVIFTSLRGMIALLGGLGRYPNYRDAIPSLLADGEPRSATVALNPRLLAGVGKGLKNVGVVRLYIEDPMKPVLIEAGGTGYREVIMPLRLP